MATAEIAPSSNRLALRANLGQLRRLALAGAIGALLGLFIYVELLRPYASLRQSGTLWWLRDVLAGVSLGAFIGFFLNVADPLRDGAARKAAHAGTWGGLAGAIGGSIGLVLGELVLGGLQGGILGRALSWSILGLGIGVSQGFANRSRERFRFGVIGGLLGGFLGGFLFESLRESLGNRYDLSQGLGAVVLGAGLGLALAFVEQALRKAWVVVLNGRQEGRNYLLATPTSTLGLDERATVGLFADREIRRQHAEIVMDQGTYEFRTLDPSARTLVNKTPVPDSITLRDGDRIEIGRTILLFRKR